LQAAILASCLPFLATDWLRRWLTASSHPCLLPLFFSKDQSKRWSITSSYPCLLPLASLFLWPTNQRDHQLQVAILAPCLSFLQKDDQSQAAILGSCLFFCSRPIKEMINCKQPSLPLASRLPFLWRDDWSQAAILASCLSPLFLFFGWPTNQRSNAPLAQLHFVFLAFGGRQINQSICSSSKASFCFLGGQQIEGQSHLLHSFLSVLFGFWPQLVAIDQWGKWKWWIMISKKLYSMLFVHCTPQW